MKKQGLTLFILILLFAGACRSTPGQSKEKYFYRGELLEERLNLFSEHHFTIGKVTLPYRLFSPSDREKIYPLIITLHGAGERGSDNKVQIERNDLALVWATQKAQKSHPVYILSPQCPLLKRWVPVSWSLSSYHQEELPPAPELEAVYALIQEIIAVYPIDRNRIYITGVSMGGIGTWEMITRYPGLFAAAIPVCGSGDPASAERIKDMPLWVFHGARDDTVPVEGSQNMVKALEGREDSLIVKKGNFTPAWEKVKKYSLIYFEYPEAGHNVWELAYHTPSLPDWLFSQSKDKK